MATFIRWYSDVSNPLSTTACVCREGDGESDLDDVHLLEGEEIQWRISLAVSVLRLSVNTCM